jgi:glycosyltransferase involved in cell wall biosynthesis
VQNSKTGLLIPIKQVSSLADSILYLLDNRQLRIQMGEAGRKRVEEYYEISACTHKIADALDEACREQDVASRPTDTKQETTPQNGG